MKKVLVVGQGIAGSTLAWSARRLGMEITILDPGSHQSASAVSSGLMNPITGRHFVKSWLIDAFLDAAYRLYGDISLTLGQKYLHPLPILRHLSSVQIENTWYAKSLTPGYEQYMSGDAVDGYQNRHFREARSFGKVLGSARLDTADMLAALRKKWIDENVLIEERFDFGRCELTRDNVSYEGEEYDAIVLAMGWEGIDNRFFQTDVYQPAKGEVLLCRIPAMSSEAIVKYHKFVVPQGKDVFWIGTTWQWDVEDSISEDWKSQELIDYLDRYLLHDYELLERKAGVRPATKYRRPLIGSHPDFPRLFLFNGLGTKGITMAPYWAGEMMGYIKNSAMTASISFTKAFERTFMN